MCIINVLIVETAINIGYSCQLLTDDLTDVFIVDATTYDGVETQLTRYLETIKVAMSQQKRPTLSIVTFRWDKERSGKMKETEFVKFNYDYCIGIDFGYASYISWIKAVPSPLNSNSFIKGTMFYVWLELSSKNLLFEKEFILSTAEYVLANLIFTID